LPPLTRREQLDAPHDEFDFRMYAPGQGHELLAWLLPIALATIAMALSNSTLRSENTKYCAQ
jgi:hypothetical protein